MSCLNDSSEVRRDISQAAASRAAVFADGAKEPAPARDSVEAKTGEICCPGVSGNDRCASSPTSVPSTPALCQYASARCTSASVVERVRDLSDRDFLLLVAEQVQIYLHIFSTGSRHICINKYVRNRRCAHRQPVFESYSIF